MKLATRSLTLAALAIAIGAPAHAADTDVETVQVGGFALEPMGHLTSPDGAVTVHPKAMIGGGYNSNVYATENFRHDAGFIEGTAGVDVGWAITGLDRVTVSGEYDGEAYDNLPGRNLQGGTGTVRYDHQAELWEANALASYARTNDPFVETGEQIKHDDTQAALGGTRHWLAESLGAGLTFARRDYLEDSLTFRKNDRDYNDYGVNARFGHELGDESEIYVRGLVDRRDYTKNTNITGTRGFNDSNGYSLMLGWREKLWTRSAMVAELGAIYRSYRYDFARDPAYNDQNVLAPAANIAFLWRFEEGSHIAARAFSTVEDSVSANAALLYGARIDARLRLAAKAALYGAIGGYQLHDSGHSAAQGSDEVRNTGEATIGGEYDLERGVGLRLQDVYTNSNSKFFNDFTRNIISLELGFVY